MENVETGSLSHVSTSVADKMANLMYDFKFGYKEKYFKALESLKNVMDKRLYMFYFRFGCSSMAWRDNEYKPKEEEFYG